MGSQTTNGVYEIFLSHSGKQKGFVTDLYNRLECLYRSVFFDITHHSLPPAKEFAPLIFEAAQKCLLAVVVLSNDFVESYWPMLELCVFVKADRKILPLFYGLSPSDLKNEGKLENWRQEWRKHAAQRSNSKHTLDFVEWENALKRLSSTTGVKFKGPSIQGEEAYLNEIVHIILQIVSPLIEYDVDRPIQGKDRLCNIIVTKFGELEASMPQPCNVEQSVPPQSSVCILGMYGLLGSGKSTICKCLCNHYFRFFDGKVHYIELPTKPTSMEQLAEECKGLLDKLTNFRSMMDLTVTSDFKHKFYSALRASNLQRSRIFLVLDNISEWNCEFVKNILSCGVGPGSKVLLVARTSHVLRSFDLHPDQREQSHYVSAACVKVPSLNEEEAIRVLLQCREDEDLLDHDFTAHETQLMEKVVYMSGFAGTGQQRLYLPFVLRLMGDQLRRRYELHVEQWGRAMGNFWETIEESKESAVRRLVQKCFSQLDKDLQFLFLDLALFIPRLPTDGGQQTCDTLSFMHHCSPTTIKKRMDDLQKHCFVEDVNHPPKIHDLFLEFAASIPESSMYYESCRSCNHMLPLPVLKAPEFKLRAVIVEELSESHKRFEFWPGYPNVKALVFRNCEKLAVLGLKGLTSLAILHIDNCPGLKSVELPACEADCVNLLDSIQWLRWVDRKNEENMVKQHKWSNNMVQMYAEQGKQLVNNAWSWFAGMIVGSHIWLWPARMVVTDLAFRMRNLQALDVRNTGIKHLGDLSKLWPLLKEMTIIENSLEHIEVGTLPYLELIVLLCDDEDSSFIEAGIPYSCGSRHYEDKFKVSPRGFKAKNLLAGCPALQAAAIRSASFEDGLGTLGTPKLRSLWLGNFSCGDKLPNLGACAKSLQKLMAHECEELRSVHFMCRFEILHELSLRGCPSITEVSGLDCLPRLSTLCIYDCKNLQTLRGLSGLVSLQGYHVGPGCPNLQVSLSDLEGMTNQLTCLQHHSNNLQSDFEGFTVRNLVNAEDLVLGSWECLPVPYCEYTLVDLTTLVGVLEPPHFSCLTSMCHLSLEGVQNLASLGGIEFLHPLEELILESLQNLSCLQGIDSLTNLRYLKVKDCASVEELPSLSQLVQLTSLILENCVKLRSVDGCDAMTKLHYLCLIECKSMAPFPLEGRLGHTPVLNSVKVYGSKFASREVLLSWLSAKEPVDLRLCTDALQGLPPEAIYMWLSIRVSNDDLLCAAALQALAWELCHSLREKPTERMELAQVVLERTDRIPQTPFTDVRFYFEIFEQVALGKNIKALLTYHDQGGFSTPVCML